MAQFYLKFSNKGRERAFILLGPVALIGILVFALYLILPRTPPSPSLSPDQVVRLCYRNKLGVQVGVMGMMIAATVWPLYSLAINNQLNRIPGVSHLALMLQQACGSTVGLAMMLIAMMFAALMFRLERDPELTVLLYDLAWLVFSMATPPWFAQEVVISQILLSDGRPKPLIPRWVGWICYGTTFVMLPGLGVHMVRHGPLAWNGGLTFWFMSFAGFSQHILLIIFLWRAAGITDDGQGVSSGLEHGVASSKL